MNNVDFNRLLTGYCIGFGAALLLSALSYIVVVGKFFESSAVTMALLLLLAVVQLVVQLIYFLHLSFSGRSFSRTGTLLVTLSMMLIIVIGSIWIMRNLDYHMSMSSDAMNQYMKAQNRKGF